MRRFPKKTVVILAVAGAVVVGTGAAYAYWTSGGSGSGNAAAGTTTPVTVVQTSTITTLAPGVAPVALAGKFNNPNTGPVFVATITAAVGTVTKAGGAPAGTCDATDFTIAYNAGTSIPVNTEIPAGTNQGSWSGATIAFNNKPATNQDACKLATVTVAYTAA